MMPARKAAVATLTLATTLLLPSEDAQAFCRTTTSTGTPDATGCEAEGLPLVWLDRCIPFGVHAAGAPERDISYSKVHEAFTRAIEEWLSADCNGVGPGLAWIDRGKMQCDLAEYAEHSELSNNNIVILRQGFWPYKEAPALTTVTYKVDSGEILDVDIEVNATGRPFDLGSDPPSLSAILLHEVGHALGLAHSTAEGSVMGPFVESDEAAPTLGEDDIDAICSIYADPAPECARQKAGADFTRECAEPGVVQAQTAPFDCQLSPPGTAGFRYPLYWLMLAAALALRRTQLHRARTWAGPAR